MTDLAEYHVLVTGSLSPQVASTCSLVIDGDHVIVIDPGLAPSQDAITDPLRKQGPSPTDVTDVVISHHHPDHTINVGLFPNARLHDHWAIYDFRGRWDSVDCEGRAISPNVRLIKTPGHSPRTCQPSCRPATASMSSRTPGGPPTCPSTTHTRRTLTFFGKAGHESSSWPMSSFPATDRRSARSNRLRADFVKLWLVPSPDTPNESVLLMQSVELP